MMDHDLAQKEIAIFEGIIKLIKGGINPYTIKVSDIAKQADVGKGTLYEYFKTKEEAISKAILYYIGRGLEEAYLAVKSQKSFQDKYYEILRILARQAQENKEQCKLMSPLGDLQDFYGHLSDYQADFRTNQTWIKKIYEDIFQAGDNEDLISQEVLQDEDYREMALIG
ncbi:MAG TPA: helix-turn-helix domain-containing protein, partial [Clostridia bacterium]|nr:helix-turn-helix domain-containing protein [Clostridia bacterium]